MSSYIGGIIMWISLIVLVVGYIIVKKYADKHKFNTSSLISKSLN